MANLATDSGPVQDYIKKKGSTSKTQVQYYAEKPWPEDSTPHQNRAFDKSRNPSELQFPYLKKIRGNHVWNCEGIIHMKVPGLLGLSLERAGFHKCKTGEERKCLKLREHRAQRSRGISEWSVQAII